MYMPVSRSGLSVPVNRGIGLFDSGLDVSIWGIAEWGLAVLGIYTAARLLGDVRSTTRKVRKSSRAKAAGRESLKKQLAAI